MHGHIVHRVDVQLKAEYATSTRYELLRDRFGLRLRAAVRGAHRGRMGTWEELEAEGVVQVGHSSWWHRLCEEFCGGTRDPRFLNSMLAQVVADVQRFERSAWLHRQP